MFVSSRKLLDMASVVDDEQEYARRFVEHQEAQAKWAKREVTIWRIQLFATISTAVIGGGTLIVSFVMGLFETFMASSGCG